MENCRVCKKENIEYFCPDCGGLFCAVCKTDICDRSDCLGKPLSTTVLKG